MSADMGVKEVAIEFDLGKEDPAMGTVSTFAKTGDMYFGMRFYYTSKHDGSLLPGKNGINVQIGQAIPLIKGLIATYNVSTNNEYVLATKDQLTQEALDAIETG